MNQHKYWSEEEDKLLIEKYQERTDKILEFFPNRSHSALIQRAMVLGIRKDRNFYIETKCDFFLDESLETYYWIGFILADGHISNKYRLNITLAIMDVEHLTKLAKILNTRIVIEHDKCYIACQDAINLKILKDKFDLKHNKTYYPPKELPECSEELLLSLFVGIIDGDGCIRYQTGRNDCLIYIHCHCSWINYYSKIHKFIQKLIGVQVPGPIIGNDGYMRWNITNHEVVIFLKKFVIENNLDVLSRKWDKIDLNRKYRTDNSKKNKLYVLDHPELRNKDIAEHLGVNDSYISTLRKKIRLGLIT